MNTISIDSDIYKGAEIYARLHKTNVKDFIERAIVAAVGKNGQTDANTMKAETELSPQVRSLIGVAREASVNDIDGREERMEYLAERQ
jgi:hypothetical protein